MADPRSDENGRLEVDRVHGNRRITAPFSVRVVSNAAAFPAPVIGPNLPVPRIFRKAAFGSFDLHRARRVVCPERAVAAADRTIAARQSTGHSCNVNSNRAAVAGSSERCFSGSHAQRAFFQRDSQHDAAYFFSTVAAC